MFLFWDGKIVKEVADIHVIIYLNKFEKGSEKIYVRINGDY